MRWNKHQHKVALYNMPWEMAAVTARAIAFRRHPAQIKEGWDQLDEAQQFIVRATTDYLAILGKGVSGFYICRSEEAFR